MEKEVTEGEYQNHRKYQLGYMHGMQYKEKTGRYKNDPSYSEGHTEAIGTRPLKRPVNGVMLNVDAKVYLQ